MKGLFRHGAGEPPPEGVAGTAVSFSVRENACCCPASPAVRVIMPATATRLHSVELLMCNHHYRLGRAALRAAGATAYDQDGVMILCGTAGAGVPGPGPEPARPAAGAR